MYSIDVPVSEDPYKIHVGSDILTELATLIPAREFTSKVALISSGPAFDLYGAQVINEIEKLSVEVHTILVEDGETSKDVETLRHCYDEFGRMTLLRRDLVVALGGGVVGDLAGFAAATWNRGVDIVQVATTLVAQVDSAIGGKTGINLPVGKNLVGAFHQPLVVVNDTATLTTLPLREVTAGLAEVVKYGFIADPVILDLLDQITAAQVHADADLMAELVRRSAQVKAQVVGGDELEAGNRAILNYGHTVGHAIETLSKYQEYRHGEAVAIGMVFAARLGERLGVSPSGLADDTVSILTRLGLPTGGVTFDRDEVWQVLALDKKAQAGVRFVLCPRPGSAIVIDPPDREVVNEVLDTLAS